jgi:parvulin-like peptidyl-prolyl isomerase
MRFRKSMTLLLTLTLLLAWPVVAEKEKKEKKKKNRNPDVVTVQHVLISFEGKLNKPIERDKKEALELAWEIFDRAEAGEDFDALVKEYTNDSHPGIYTMTNRGAAKLKDAFTRGDMAVSFGDVSFRLDVGEVGMAKYHPDLSPFGFHIIKRLE